MKVMSDWDTVMATIAGFIWVFVGAMRWADNKTQRQRDQLKFAIHRDSDPIHRQELVEAYNSISFNLHWWYVLTFRSAWKLYPRVAQKAVGAFRSKS